MPSKLKKAFIVPALTCMTAIGSTYAFASTREVSLKPNVIVILVDDVGYADISADPGSRFKTPNIDRIAQQGVLFTDGYATAPVCAPSRAGLLTGRYQERFGYEYNNGPAARDMREGLGVSLNEITIAQLLKGDGYHTGMIGKWHLGSQPQFYPMNRGFDDFVGFLPGETSYMDPTLPGVHLAFGPFSDDLLHQLVLGKTPPVADVRALLGARAALVSDDDLDARGMKLVGTFTRRAQGQIVEGADRHIVHNEDQYLTDYFGDRASQYIAQNSRSGRPYFLYLAFNAAHTPLMVTDKYYQRFPQIRDHQLRVYAAMISALDDNVGKVLDAVKKSGQANNTLIVFASDNGCAEYMPGLCPCEPLRGGKLSQYEGGTRVPFMMRWPGHIEPGTVYRNAVSLLDVLPTAVAAAGGKLPTDRVYDGVNLIPYLNGQNKNAPHETLVWRREPLVSIRNGDWKLWETQPNAGIYGDYKLLFNLKDDLNETTNLADKNPEEVKALERLIEQWEGPMVPPAFPSKKPQTFEICGKTFTLPI